MDPLSLVFLAIGIIVGAFLLNFSTSSKVTEAERRAREEAEHKARIASDAHREELEQKMREKTIALTREADEARHKAIELLRIELERESHSRIEAEVSLKAEREAAERNAKATELRAKEEARAEIDRELKERKNELLDQKRELLQKEDRLNKNLEATQKREQELQHREKKIEAKEKSSEDKEKAIDETLLKSKKKLEEIADLTADEAKKQVVSFIEEEARMDAAKRVKLVEEEAKEEAEKRAKRIVSIAIGRYAGEYVVERAVSVVQLPSDEMKGRIIGREGRNIRALEAATGVDIIIDDTPETIIVSGYDPVRREIARLSIEQLIADGRIHPTRIEEIVEKMTQQVDGSIKEAGERAVLELGLHKMHPELIRLVGRLKYRYSYAQNQWSHAIEVAHIVGLMASELGFTGNNLKNARRAGLLHDIGKAVDQEFEGGHAVIGAQLAKKYGEPAAVVHAIAAHHEDEKPETVLAHLVAAGDALSGARPGARREMLENYVKRLEELETISKGFAGVDRAFAIQAGREVRVMVENARVNDEQAIMLSRDIAKKIEEDLTYPGQIKVTVIRETRAVEFAK
jgi:ribonucrease Y